MWFDEVKGFKNVLGKYVKLRNEFETTKDHVEKISLLRELLHYYERVATEIVFWIKRIIPDIEYIVGCIDWTTICITSRSERIEGEIELSEVLNKAIPEEYREYVRFYAPEIYVTHGEAERIREVIGNLFIGMESS